MLLQNLYFQQNSIWDKFLELIGINVKWVYLWGQKSWLDLSRVITSES